VSGELKFSPRRRNDVGVKNFKRGLAAYFCLDFLLHFCVYLSRLKRSGTSGRQNVEKRLVLKPIKEILLELHSHLEFALNHTVSIAALRKNLSGVEKSSDVVF
jgi:hypothetical protein